MMRELWVPPTRSRSSTPGRRPACGARPATTTRSRTCSCRPSAPAGSWSRRPSPDRSTRWRRSRCCHLHQRGPPRHRPPRARRVRGALPAQGAGALPGRPGRQAGRQHEARPGEGAVESGHSYVRGLRRSSGRGRDGDRPTMADHGALRLAAAHAGQTALEAIELLYGAAGADAVYATSPLNQSPPRRPDHGAAHLHAGGQLRGGRSPQPQAGSRARWPATGSSTTGARASPEGDARGFTAGT